MQRIIEAILRGMVTVSFGSVGSIGQSQFLPVIAGVVAIALIVLVIFVAVQIRKYYPTLALRGPVDLFTPSSPVVVDRATTGTMSGTYTLAFYVKMDAVPDMRATATPLLTWPSIWNLNYNPAQEKMVWIIHPVGSKAETFTIPVPLQRWAQIMVTFEGRSFDFYVNGSLVSSHILANLPPVPNSSITIVPGGIMGQIAHAQVWPRRLTVNEVGSNYLDTSDSQGRPYLSPVFNLALPNLFCPSGKCKGTQPTATPSQTWEFPYA